MISNSDSQKWQTTVNGINESGQKELTGEEWSALMTLNNSLQNSNLESDKSHSALTLLKNNLSRHDNNQILQMHLQNFIDLCDRNFKTTGQIIPPTANPIVQLPETAGSNTVKTKSGSSKTLIFVFVAVITVFLIYSNRNAISRMGGGGLPNGRYEIANLVGSGSLPNIIVITGNNFTEEWDNMLGVSTTVKYKYNDGKIIFTDKGMSVSLPCEFKNGSLWYSGIEYKKVN